MSRNSRDQGRSPQMNLYRSPMDQAAGPGPRGDLHRSDRPMTALRCPCRCWRIWASRSSEEVLPVRQVEFDGSAAAPGCHDFHDMVAAAVRRPKGSGSWPRTMPAFTECLRPRLVTARWRMTAYNALVLKRRAAGARSSWSSCAPTASYLRQAGIALLQRLSGSDAGRGNPILLTAPVHGRCSCALRSRPRQGPGQRQSGFDRP